MKAFLNYSLLALLMSLVFSCSSSVHLNEASSLSIQSSKSVHSPQSLQTDRLLIKRGTIKIEVKDLIKATKEIHQLAKSHEGYLENNTVSEKDSYLTVRVPAPSLDTLIQQMTDLGNVINQSINAQDVTDSYYDLKTRLDNKKAFVKRLRSLLQKTKKLSEVVDIEKELSRLQTDIDRLVARQKRLDKNISMSVLNVTLKKEKTLGPLGYLSHGIFWTIRKLFVWED